MDAAEQLVALHSEQGVSSRAIIATAGQRHNSAITYYFGDRRSLLDAVWTRGSAIVNDRRREMLADLGDRRRDLRDLVRIWVVPFASYLDSRHPSYWARFNEDALRLYPLAFIPALRTTVASRPQGQHLIILVELFEAMADALRRAGRSEPDARVSTVVRMAISAFAAWEREDETDRACGTATELGTLLVDMCIAALGGDLSAAG